MYVESIVVTHKFVAEGCHTHQHTRNDSRLGVDIVSLFEYLLVVLVHTRRDLSMLLLTLNRQLTATTIGIDLGAGHTVENILTKVGQFVEMCCIGKDIICTIELLVTKHIARAVTTIVADIEGFIPLRCGSLLLELGRIEAIYAQSIARIAEDLLASRLLLCRRRECKAHSC